MKHFIFIGFLVFARRLGNLKLSDFRHEGPSIYFYLVYYTQFATSFSINFTNRQFLYSLFATQVYYSNFNSFHLFDFEICLDSSQRILPFLNFTNQLFELVLFRCFMLIFELAVGPLILHLSKCFQRFTAKFE